jgi:hypothetical protein
MQALESLRAAVSGARAAVSGAVGGGAGGILHSLPILGHLTGADESRHEVPHLPETGFVGADAICAAAGKRVEDYLGKRSTKARRSTLGATRLRCVPQTRSLRDATAASMPCEVLAAVASLSRRRTRLQREPRRHGRSACFTTHARCLVFRNDEPR